MDDDFELIRRKTDNTGTRRQPPVPPEQKGKKPTGTGRATAKKRRARKPVYRQGSAAAAKHKRRQRRGIIVLLAAVLLIGVAILFSTDVIFKVENIRVETMARETPADTGIYSEEEIIRATGIQQGAALFSVSAKKLSAQLLVQLPYLEEVNVRYSLPTTVAVQVTPAVESLYLTQNGRYYILSETLRVLQATDNKPAGLISLSAAVEGEPQVGRTLDEALAAEDEEKAQNLSLTRGLVEITDCFRQEGLYPRITAIDLSDMDDAAVTLNGGLVVRLGTLNNLDYKCRMAGNILRNEDGQGVPETDKGILDVSNSPATGKAYFAPNNNLAAESAPEPEPEEGGTDEDSESPEGDENAEGGTAAE